MKRIVIEAVSQQAMRPPYHKETEAGDWLFDDAGNLLIRVIGDDLGKRETFLFAFHELAEAFLCHDRGITQAQVDAFDKQFDDWPIVDPEAEPGDHKASVYRREHRQAMILEHLLANFLGMTGYGTVR